MEMEEDFIDYRMSDCPNCGYVDIDESKCIEWALEEQMILLPCMEKNKGGCNHNGKNRESKKTIK